MSIAQIFCYEPSKEWVLYLIIELALIAFFVVSCYNANRLIKFKDNDAAIRNGLNIAIECVIIFVGCYLGFIWYKITYRKGSVSKLQSCFFGHIAPFLVLTGLAALSATAKRIEQAKLGNSL
jgi:D-alanyl-lipoteichoic acid acyltransferase DltB (MBOAT superfamily)